MQLFDSTLRAPAQGNRSTFVNAVFLMFGLALALCAGGVFGGYALLTMYPEVFANPLVFYGAIALELILAFTVHMWQEKRPLGYVLFVLYALLSGFTLAPILSFVALTAGLPMIGKALLSTTAMFAGAALYGWITHKDLSRMGGILTMALIGLIITTVINIFLGSSLLEFGMGIFGVVLFSIYTAYDIQMIKSHYSDNMVLAAGMSLFISFINLFVSVLRVLTAFGDNS